MNGSEHYRMAESLLESCQVPSLGDPDYEYYPPMEDNGDDVQVNTCQNALAAAQVHATLALVAATVPRGANWTEVTK